MTESASLAPEGESTIQSDLTTSVEELLDALRAVALGDLSRQLRTRYPESHPVGALVSSINSMITELREARAKSAGELDQLSDRLSTIDRQRDAIQNLSVPIIEVWNGVLCVPVVGILDSQRAAELTSTLLLAVVEKRSKHVIVDVTGIEAMDTSSADHFLRIARSVTLLGAQCLLSGMHPNVARTIVHMGVELHGLQSHRTMRDALKRCVLESRQKTPRKKPQ
jgi:rsbT co-antagonist protein RsbR